MKYTLVTIFFVIICFTTGFASQNVVYEFNSDGNLIHRNVFRIRSVQARAVDTISIVDENQGNKITIYPNPTKGHFHFKVNILDEQVVNTYAIYNSAGMVLKTDRIQNYLTDVDISEYPNGFFLLKICLGDKMSTWKIIKQ